jgi:hypothetical protein
MTALLASLFLVADVLIPGVIFQTVFSIFIPLKRFQRTRVEEIAFAIGVTILPISAAIALSWATGCLGSPTGGFLRPFEAYRVFFAGSYSEQVFLNGQPEFWRAAKAVSREQVILVIFYYFFIAIEAALLGLLSSKYGRLREYWLYDWIARKVLLPSISEWHVLLTAFSFQPQQKRRVMADVLTTDDHLFHGKVGDYFLDRDGNLSGILLADALRFDRRTYLRDKDAGKQGLAAQYWKSIPGENIYLFADKIGSLNLTYESSPPRLIRKIVEDLRITPHVRVEEI